MKTYKKILLLFPIVFLLGFGVVKYNLTKTINETVWVGSESEPTFLIESINLNDSSSTNCEIFFIKVTNNCQTEGTINLSDPGTYQITYTAIYEDRAEIVSVQFLVLSDYYSSAVGKSGNELLIELRSIMNSTMQRVTYGEARDILQETDQDPNNANNLITFYRQESVLSTWDVGVTWNREHIWPQSRLGVSTNNSSRHVGADLHNLKPENPSENTSRSNKFFNNTTISGSYVPPENVRGDVARILFYMILTYDYLKLVEEETETLYQMGVYSTLLEWHFLDLPDEFEINRNNIIESYQGNRNPFIDYPLFWTLINYQLEE